MNPAPNRRDFLATASSSLAGAAAAFLLPGTAFADDHKPKEPRFTIGLSQYSLRALLKDGSLDALDYPQFTMDTFGITAIDFWEGGLPKDKLDDADYLAKLRANAEKAGTEIFLLMTGALHAQPKKRNVDAIAKSLPRAKQLGAEFLRVFLKAPGADAAAAIPVCVEALKPLGDKAAEHDVKIAIEPGASPLSQKGTFLAKVMDELKHPAVILMPDFGKQKGNVYDGTEAMLPYTETVSCKMHSFDGDGNQPDFDYPRLMQMIADSDYRGILSIEWEGSKLEPIPGVNASKALIEKSLAAADIAVEK